MDRTKEIHCDKAERNYLEEVKAINEHGGILGPGNERYPRTWGCGMNPGVCCRKRQGLSTVVVLMDEIDFKPNQSVNCLRDNDYAYRSQ